MTPETQKELMEIEGERGKLYRRLLASEPDLLPAYQAVLAGVAPWVLVWRPDLLPELQMVLAKKADSQIADLLLSRGFGGDLKEEVIVELASSKDWRVRQRAAWYQVRKQNSDNRPRTVQVPRWVLADLAKDTAVTVRRILAESEQLPPDIVAELACDADRRVRIAAVEHNTFQSFSDIAARIVSDPDKRVREAAKVAIQLTTQRGAYVSELPPRLRETQQ